VRVLINICRDGWRKQAVRTRVHASHPPPQDRSRSHETETIARAIVQQALGSLPPRRRAIVVMYELEGATIPAIASLLGIGAVTVRWHLSMGRRELAKAIGEPR